MSTAWSPVIGPIILPNGQPAGLQLGLLSREQSRSQYDRTILAHLMQSPWDDEFHQAEPVILAASAVNQRVTQFTNLSSECAVVRGVAMGVALLADFDNIRWAVRVDGTPRPGFDNIRGPFGVFVYPKPVLIPLYPDQTVEIVATNLTAVAIADVTAYLMGTHFPVDLFPMPGAPGEGGPM